MEQPPASLHPVVAGWFQLKTGSGQSADPPRKREIRDVPGGPDRPESCLDRSGSSRCEFSTKHRPRRPFLSPFRGHFCFSGSLHGEASCGDACSRSFIRFQVFLSGAMFGCMCCKSQHYLGRGRHRSQVLLSGVKSFYPDFCPGVGPVGSRTLQTV